MSTKLNWTPVKSTQIKRIAHDAETNTAIVHFTNGGIYEYAEFPPEKFELFKSSESAGKFLGAEVKGKHPYKKVTDPAQLMDLLSDEGKKIPVCPECQSSIRQENAPEKTVLTYCTVCGKDVTPIWKNPELTT